MHVVILLLAGDFVGLGRLVIHCFFVLQWVLYMVAVSFYSKEICYDKFLVYKDL